MNGESQRQGDAIYAHAHPDAHFSTEAWQLAGDDDEDEGDSDEDSEDEDEDLSDEWESDSSGLETRTSHVTQHAYAHALALGDMDFNSVRQIS